MATTVFELFGSIAIKNRDANEALKDTATKAERTGKQIQDAFKKIGSVSLKIGKGVAAAATAIGTAWTANIESTRDYRQAMAKLDAAFLTNGHRAETAKNAYKALQRVLGDTDQATEAANHLAVLCDNEQELDKMTHALQGVYAQWGDSLPLEGLAEACNHTAKLGEVQGPLADALEWSGIKTEDFNLKLKACRTEEERQQLIMDTLYWTYKKAADQYEVTGESVMKANEAQDNLNRSLAKIAEIGEPIMTNLKNWIAGMVNEAAPHLQTLIDKLVNFNDTMTNEIWPWIQQEAKMKLGMELPDWETFKSDVTTWWTTNGPKIADTAAFTLRCIGIGEWTEADTQRLRDWWDGVAAKAVEICKWLINPPELPNPDALVSAITSWWNGIRSRLNLTFGVKAQTYAGDLASVSTGSDIGDAYVQATSVNPDAPWASGLLNLFRPNGSHASGLENVPRDGYLARVHKGEAILNSAQANEWRGGGNVEALLAQIVANTGAGKSIVLDSGVMVGQLAPAMDGALGTIASRKRRGS